MRLVSRLLVAGLCWSVAPAGASAQAVEAERGVIVAVRAARPPSIDGQLGDEAWAQAMPATRFIQRDPDEGKPATERTEVRILYDEAALYVGARLYDAEPDRIVRQLTNRDSVGDADWIQVQLDPLHDHLTGFQFTVSAAGVQRDAIISNDTFIDGSWDAVWESAVSIDRDGWSAEVRIPLSQLRFARGDRQTWGINLARFIHRKAETSWFEPVPRNQSGVASRMGHLTGLEGVAPRPRLELLPYTAARAEFIAPTRAGDPFNDGARAFGAVGLDVKWGLTGNLTLDATVNPDFGQVEVDPAVVNLTDIETFFPERRPFFVEGAQIFNNFGQGGANNNININASDPRIFYSRRIGRPPQLSPAGDFIDEPIGATILGALKVSGKTGNGWSLGLIEALTGREEARIDAAGRRSRAEVEPMTNYFVARVQRDLSPRAAVGVLATGVTRDLDSGLAQRTLAQKAFVVGADGHVFLDNRRDWVINGKLAVSHLDGTPAAIARAQRSSQRYYQRPDAPHVSLDLSRTSLNGMMGRVNLNRNSGDWQVNAALWGVSPGFDSNDLGFHTQGDRAGAHGVLFWRKTATDRVTRFRQAAFAAFSTWNYNRDVQSRGWAALLNAQFLNYWGAEALLFVVGEGQDDRLTRGGPSARAPGGYNWNFNVRSDGRRRLTMSVNGSLNESNAGSSSRNVNLSVSWRPLTALSLSTGPSWNGSRNVAQYVRTVADPAAAATYGSRYVFGTIDQRQVSMTTRVSYVVSPKMSVQLFAQPLLAVGDYTSFKELARPRTYDFLEYGTAASVSSYDAAARRYTVDPDGAGAGLPFSFGDPDFNFKSLRVNTVFRWELRPGSNLYAVWTRRQQDLADPGDFRLGRDASALFRAPGDDVLLVKIAYWLGR